MGIHMRQMDSDFRVKREQFKPMLQAIAELMTQTDKMGGGGWFSGERWFSWVHTASVMRPLKEALAAEDQSAIDRGVKDVFCEWSWTVDIDDDGILAIFFDGDQSGAEDELLQAIAAYVEDGGYIQMLDEDDHQWRWAFNSGKMELMTASIVWERHA
jgi:hypothetical protein